MKDYKQVTFKRRVNGTREHRDCTSLSEFFYGCALIAMAFGFSFMFYYGF